MVAEVNTYNFELRYNSGVIPIGSPEYSENISSVDVGNYYIDEISEKNGNIVGRYALTKNSNGFEDVVLLVSKATNIEFSFSFKKDFFGFRSVSDIFSSFTIDMDCLKQMYKDFSFLGGNNTSSVDFSSLSKIEAKQDMIFDRIANIDMNFNGLGNMIKSFNFVSLDGTNGTLKDGTSVLVENHTQVFKIIGSQIFMNTEKNYMIIYLLENDNKRFLVPEMYVSIPNTEVSS